MQSIQTMTNLGGTNLDEILNQIAHDPYLSKINHYFHSAWLGHAPFLKFLVREQKPSVFVELGVHNGFSYFMGCQSIRECSLNTKSYAIDHWEGDSQAGFFDDTVYQGVVKENNQYREFSSLLKMSFSEALNSFKDQSVDLLHIDGFHSYEAIKEDFDSWLPKVNPNGIILLHDIHVRRNTFGVYKFWSEIKTRYTTIEFVGSHGLGVVFLGDIPAGKLSELVKFSLTGGLPQIQGTFGSISDDVIQNAKYGELLSALAERDGALAERDGILNSTIWKIFKPYRMLKDKL